MTKVSEQMTADLALVTDVATTDAKSLITPVYNVVGYGADRTGTTESSAAIQAAIDDCIANGDGTVYFPDGTYKIDTGIVVSNPTNLTLLGLGDVRLYVNTNTVNAIKIVGAAGTYHRNFHMKGINIYYPIGASATTGYGIWVAIDGTTNMGYSTFSDMRIDNARIGVYIPDSILWYTTFENIEITGGYTYGFQLTAPGASNGNSIKLKHVFVNNMTTGNPAYKVSGCYGFEMDHCAADGCVKFGEITVRGLTMRNCGAESIDLESLATSGAFLDIGASQDRGVLIEGMHFHLAAEVATNAEKYLIRSAAPAEIRDLHFFGGTTGDEATWSLPSSIYLFIGTGSYVYRINGVQTRWAGGGRIRVNTGTLYLSNIDSTITSKTVGTGDMFEASSSGVRVTGSGMTSAIREYYGSGAPTAGTWVRGDTVWSVAPAAGGYMGWVCTAGGTPGTWKTFGAITP